MCIILYIITNEDSHATDTSFSLKQSRQLPISITLLKPGAVAPVLTLVRRFTVHYASKETRELVPDWKRWCLNPNMQNGIFKYNRYFGHPLFKSGEHESGQNDDTLTPL